MIFFVILSLAIAGLFVIPALASEDVPRITKEELKALLGNPDVILLDVRIESHWNASEFKIKDAIRERPKEFGSWVDKYPKEKTIVFY